MATRQESVLDGMQWLVSLARVSLRRAAIIGLCAATFAVAVVISTRERVSDCGGVSESQRELLAELREPDPIRPFVADSEATCEAGLLSAPIDGLAGEMDTATEQLIAAGWTSETNYISYFEQRWRRCFVLDVRGWEEIQVTIDAAREGTGASVWVAALEEAEGCDLERRNKSEIYPPRR